ncbi:MAG TPA: ATP-dependent metallopeptidase FtsH/Yme1/Tma family protein [Campylobacterales bacterium]|nr:ATP-dependent metallopeptidase FtsH/Yme1/Tma family protein [Campylobacterales bacterium]
MWQSISNNSKIILVSVVLLFTILLISFFNTKTKHIQKAELQEILNSKTLEQVVVSEPYIYLYTKEADYKIAKEAVDMDMLFEKTLVEYQEDSLAFIDIFLLMFIIGFTLYIISSIKESKKRNEEFILESKDKEMGLLKEQKIVPQLSRVTFSQVAGIEDVKEELEEVIDFLRFPQKYKSFDIRLPKGVLLIGPPGVGKTLIAKAVAGEAGVPFFYQSGASFVHIYVGMGAKRVSELFAKAKEMSPSIIFIDEIDAVGKSRGGQNNDEREATLNQLLTEMDGFEESSGVMLIAATNKIEVLDEALLRAGRFDRRIHISLPNFSERLETLELYLKNKKHSIEIKKIAEMTIGFNSAAIATLINEAALYALSNNKKSIETSDIEAVKDKVLLGKHKIKIFNEEEKKIQALYQAAKAVSARWLEVEYEKIGLLSSDFRPYPSEILSKTLLENEIKVLLSGRIATEMRYKELFSNAKEDIYRAKLLTRQIIDEFVMSDEYFGSSNYSETVMQEATTDVTSLLKKLDPVIKKVEEYLYLYESISYDKTQEMIDEIF